MARDLANRCTAVRGCAAAPKTVAEFFQKKLSVFIGVAAQLNAGEPDSPIKASLGELPAFLTQVKHLRGHPDDQHQRNPTLRTNQHRRLQIGNEGMPIRHAAQGL